MELSTRIVFPKSSFRFSYSDKLLLLGSCFAENIGLKLNNYKFNLDVNPFGTLYNPCSIASAIQILKSNRLYAPGELFFCNDQYHSFDHHSRFSSPSEKECLEEINTRLLHSRKKLKDTRVTIITLGTSFIYHLKDTGRIVANCHKLPEKNFDRKRYDVNEITGILETIYNELKQINPEICLLFTVSPIRHWRDGAHANQLSKATLLLATDNLIRQYPDKIAYFPAYEIMMDELRDYRFYADDMLHPSPLAIDYIWERFAENYIDRSSLELMKEWDEVLKALRHRPFDPQSEAYQRFIVQTLLKIERITEKFPFFDTRNEINLLKSKAN